MHGYDDLIFSKIYTTIVKSYENKNKSNIDIQKKFFYCNSDKAIFILPQWRSKALFYFQPLIKKLRSKYTIVLYDLPYNLLSDNVKLTVYLFNKIAKDIISTFNKLQKKWT